LLQLGMLYGEGYQDRARALAAFRLALKVAAPNERPLLLQQVPADYRAELASAPQTSANSK
ncbi:MAG TPA: hypothetical protein VFB71_05795, partial [Ramlibacter sp.]|nr:hypothetical protein [Ramlibacter sp.]